MSEIDLKLVPVLQKVEGWTDDVTKALDRNEVSLEHMCKRMLQARDTLDTLKETTKKVQRLYDLLRTGKIPEMMDEQGIKTVTYDDIGRVTVTSDIRARINKPDQEAAYKWLEENGFDDLIIETVNASTLVAFCKRRIKEGEELPEVFKIQPFSRVSITQVR